MALAVILLFVLFQKRKNKLLRRQQATEARFKEEIIETQIEIREETLRNISWELHDNIGQMLTLAKIQLQNIDGPTPAITEASQTVAKSLAELRSLSKLINPDTFKNLSLHEALQLEIARFNRMKYLNAAISFSGPTFQLDKKAEVIIFRILQEFFTNTVKHSKASKLSLSLNYKDSTLSIRASDNGIGFQTTAPHANKGIGLSNIKNRAKLIKATATLTSQKGKGTQLYLTYKNKKR